MKKIKVLAISGSLREKSYNTALIRAVARLAPDDMEIIIYDEMAHLPLFNPDREDETIVSVKKLQDELGSASGLIISSPEYAHGISGVLKNALDWLVAGSEFPGMPVVICNTSPRATHAQAALREVVSTMSGHIIEKASICVPLLGTDLDASGIINNQDMSQYIIEKLTLFKGKITEGQR